MASWVGGLCRSKLSKKPDTFSTWLVVWVVVPKRKRMPERIFWRSSHKNRWKKKTHTSSKNDWKKHTSGKKTHIWELQTKHRFVSSSNNKNSLTGALEKYLQDSMIEILGFLTVFWLFLRSPFLKRWQRVCFLQNSVNFHWNEPWWSQGYIPTSTDHKWVANDWSSIYELCHLPWNAGWYNCYLGEFMVTDFIIQLNSGIPSWLQIPLKNTSQLK